MQVEIKNLVRENILNLKPYSSARSEFKGDASVFLDANENPYGSPLDKKYNRYPDTSHALLKETLATMNDVSHEQVCVGNGSDELIDHIIRIFCRPGVDEILVCPPTFKMYETAAAINDIRVKRSFLKDDFQPDVKDIIAQVSDKTKVLFLCSPNNPTGNSVQADIIETLLNQFKGVLVIDEAYIHFSKHPSFIQKIKENNNLIILQTMSKAWGMAGLRLGVAFADQEIIDWMMRVKMPYNVNTVSQALVLKALAETTLVENWRKEILDQRAWVEHELRGISAIIEIYPSDANFILFRVRDAAKLYHYLASKGIIVRNQSSQPGLQNCLRATIGTPEENKILINELKNYTE